MNCKPLNRAPTMLKYLLSGLIIFLFSCNNTDNSQKANADNKEAGNEAFPIKELQIDKSEEEGWGADIKLSIVSIADTDTTKDYKAISTYKGKNLGLLLSVPKAKEGNKGFAKGITFKTIGPESDYLLLTLSNLYKQKAGSSLKFVSSASVTYVNLKEFSKSLGAKDGGDYTTASEYKLFFEGNRDEDYGELYLNISPDDHWIELKEKDEEYRPAVIKFLKQ
jgi:hypothetical protein